MELMCETGRMPVPEGLSGMETMAFVRGRELCALLEATAIARLVESLDKIIAEADARAADDAIA